MLVLITADDVTFGARVNRLRTGRGWSYRELARRACFHTHGIIFKIERGRGRLPSLDVLGPLSAAFEMSPSELIEPVKFPHKPRPS